MKFNILLILGFLVVGNLSFAQSYDADKMARDIEIAEDVLIKLIQQQLNTETWRDDVEGKYVDDYGVVFTIRTLAESYAVGFGKDQIYIRNGRFGIKGGLALLDKDEVADEQFDRMEVIRTTAIDFLTDYAFLIRQLQADDKILLNFVDDWDESVIINPFPDRSPSQKRTATLTAEIQRSDINDFRSRDISEEDFIDRIRFSENETEEVKDPDIELLISIFNRLYDEDLTETFIIDGSGRYTSIQGLGTIIDLEVYYPREEEIESGIIIWNDGYSQKRRVYRSSREGQDRETDEEEEEKVQKATYSEHYDTFIEGFKENVIEYGQTVKSLSEEEMLMFRLHFDAFNDAYLVDVNVPQAVLQDYAAGEITLEKAVESVKVTKKEKEDDWR
ncbi:MAG: hypothetical protein AAFO82_00245 [Bacteroidota bacterium]